MDQNELEEKVDEIKRNSNSYFKPWYKIKVVDTVKQENEGVLTLFDLSEEGFSNIGEGERYRIINLQSNLSKGNYFQDQVHLSVSKSSRIVNMCKKFPHLV